MSQKYEIGQKVIVIDGSDIDDYTGGFVHDMGLRISTLDIREVIS